MPVEENAAAKSAPRLRWPLGYPFAVLVLVLSLIMVVLAWRHVRGRELELASEQFRSHAGQQASLVQTRMVGFETTLRGGASLFAALDHPTPSQWQGYVDALNLPSQFPSLVGLGYAAYLDSSSLTRLQETWRSDGYGLLSVRPSGRRQHYGPILYLEPRTEENRRAQGYDMYAEPVRKRAMHAAMESGLSQLSGEVVLVQDSGQQIPALLLYTPVYQEQMSRATVADRQQAMRGWVYVPFRIDVMIQNALVPIRDHALMRIVDTTGDAQNVLHQDSGIGGNHAFTHSLTMTFYGRRWRFDFFSGAIATAAPQLAAVDRLLYAGLFGALLLFALAWMLASTETRATRIAASMTDSFRRSEQRFRNAMQYSGIGKALLDSTGNIVDTNPAFEQIAGRSREDLTGRLLTGFIEGEGMQPLRTGQLEALDDHDAVVRITRVLRRDDGATRHVHLTFAPVPNEPGTDIVRLVQVEDVTERVRAEAAVQALNRTLEARVAARTRELTEANKELESFAYSVSHDLRAPLRGIDGFSRILAERYAGKLDETGVDYLNRVRKAATRMGELIDAMLKLSRIGRVESHPAEIDLSALAEEVVAGLVESEPQRRVDVRIQPDMRANGDRTLMMNLLGNLIGNAWKFTRGTKDARIEVGIQPDEQGREWYYVRDNGAGFDPDYANKLFRPFQRLHSQDDFDGHGIGLASVKRIVERHGGHIAAQGEPGKGATFRFTLDARPESGPGSA